MSAATLRERFLCARERSPGATALVVGDRALSYAELDELARRYAHALCDAAGGPVERVGILCERTPVAYAGVLAALYAGAAFVPLSSDSPLERTRRMLARADVDALLVDASAVPRLESLLAGLPRPPLVLMPESDARPLTGASATLGQAELRGRAPIPELPALAPDAIAYLLFTSGSTGEPKGVPVTHRNASHFLDAVASRYRFDASDRFSQTFQLTFDLSVFDLFAAWECGARVCVLGPLDLLAPGRFIRSHELTVWFSVPSIPARMRQAGTLRKSSLPSLRYSLFCGEPLPRASAEAWSAAAPHATLENLYGPTELTIACLVHRFDPQRRPAFGEGESVPIGTPFPGLRAIVVDTKLRPVAPGDPGELCVSGPQTVPGYWRDPAQTGERFVVLPLGEGAGAARFYRTGDRVRELQNGELTFLGRLDHQVKIRGHRVELGEIEAALRADPNVSEAVALAWPLREGAAEGVVAFVSGRAIDPEALGRQIALRLPVYMQPSRIEVRDVLPHSANGKLDRQALCATLELEAGAP